LETVFGGSWDLDLGALDGLERPGQQGSLDKLASVDSEVRQDRRFRFWSVATGSSNKNGNTGNSTKETAVELRKFIHGYAYST